MPQALVAVFTAIGATATVATVAAYAISFIGTLALSSYQRKKAEKQAKSQYDAAQVDRLVNLPASVVPLELVLGRVRKGGPIVFRGTTGFFFNSQLFICIALAGHEIDAVEQVYFNETPITIDGDGKVLTPPWGGFTERVSEQMMAPGQIFDLGHLPNGGSVKAFRSVGGLITTTNPDGTVTYGSSTPIDFSLAGSVITLSEFQPFDVATQIRYYVVYEWTRTLSNASVYVHLGGDNQPADAAMMASFPPSFWTAAHQARGIAYLAVLLNYNENSFSAGVPNITALVRGAKCYDPRTGTAAFSSNPSLHMLHVLTHPQFGKRPLANVTSEELARFASTASACEIGVDYGDGVVPMYRSATVVPFGTAARDVFDDLSQAMGGAWAYASGQLYLRPGVWQAPVKSLTDADLAVVQRSNDGSVSQQSIGISVHRPRLDKINTVVARIWDESVNYQQTPLPPFKATELIASDGAELSQEVNMPAVFYWRQAMHVAGIMLRDDRDPMTVTLPFKMTAYALELFDSVTLTLSRYGWVAKEFLIQERRFSPEGVLILTLKETAAAIYQVGAPIVRTGYASNTTLPKPWNVEPPVITLIDSGEAELIIQGDGTIINGVRVSWQPISNPAVLDGGTVEVQWRVVGEESWRSSVVAGNATSVVLTGASDLQYIAIRARALTSLASSDWTPTIVHQVVGKSAPPPDLEGLSIAGSVLSWTMRAAPPDLAGYVFRFHYGNNIDWGSAAPLHAGLVTENPWEPETRPGGVVTIMGKAQDTSGNQSKTAAVIVMNLGDPPIANVVEQWDLRASGWPYSAVDSSGWSLVGGNPSANAVDSFYGTEDQSFYGGDAEPFYGLGSYAQLVYVTPEIAVSAALAGSVMTVEALAQGVDLRIEYRLSGAGSFYGPDTAAFYRDNASPMYGPPGPWMPWPGQIVAANGAYQFRVTLGAGTTRGVLQELVITVDAPDLQEVLPNVTIALGGTAIPYTKPFTSIKAVTATLQANGSGAETVRIDKTVPMAPVIRAYNGANSAVAGATADIVVQGY